MRHAFCFYIVSSGMRNITTSLRRWTRNYTKYHSPRKGDKGCIIVICLGYPLMFSPVVVGMSGGVDSSVTACLLAERVCGFK